MKWMMKLHDTVRESLPPPRDVAYCGDDRMPQLVILDNSRYFLVDPSTAAPALGDGTISADYFETTPCNYKSEG